MKWLILSIVGLFVLVIAGESLAGAQDQPIIEDEDEEDGKLIIPKEEGLKLQINKFDDEEEQEEEGTEEQEVVVEEPYIPPGTAAVYVPGATVWLADVRGAYFAAPYVDLIMDQYFTRHPTLSTGGVGVDIIYRKVGSYDLLIGIDYVSLNMPSMNWTSIADDVIKSTSINIGKNQDELTVENTEFVEFNLSTIAISATFLWHINLHRTTTFFFGAGLGIGFLFGDIYSTDLYTYPACSPPVGYCGHWDDATRDKKELPTPVLPMLNLVSGFNFQIHEHFFFRIEGGIRNLLLYGGGALGSAF